MSIRLLQRSAGALAMVLIGAFGFAKLVDLPDFAQSVRAWTIVPRALAPAVVVGVPLLEVALSGLFAVGLARRVCCQLALALVVCLSGAYTVQWLLGPPPPCGCFGVIARHFHELEHAKGLLIKNSVLTVLLASSLWPATETKPSCPAMFAGREARHTAGFTLTEMLLVICLVGTLVALGAPSIAHVRDGGRAAKSLSNLRSHAAIVSMYTNDFRESYPALTDPAATWSVIRCPTAGLSVTVRYFDAFCYWHLGLADQYYGGSWDSPTFQTPWDPAPGGGATSYHMSCSFLADPAYYNQSTRRVPPAQLRAIRVADVTFPSAKGLFTAYTPWVTEHAALGRQAKFQAATTDGRAGTFGGTEIAEQYPNGDGGYPSYTSVHDVAYTPMTHTIDGAHGRDLVRR